MGTQHGRVTLFYSVGLHRNHVLATANTRKIGRGLEKMQVNGPEEELYLRLVRPEWTELSHGLLAVRHQSQSVSQSSVSQCHCRCRELFRWFHVHSDPEGTRRTQIGLHVPPCWFCLLPIWISRSIRFFHHLLLTSCWLPIMTNAERLTLIGIWQYFADYW